MPRPLASLAVLASLLSLSGCGGSERPSAGNSIETDPAATRSEYSFNLNTKWTSGRVSLNTTPTYNTAALKQYEGKWMGLKVRFSERASGSSELTIWNNNVSLTTYKFASYRVSDFGSMTTNSSGTTDQFSMYLSDNVTQVKYPIHACTVSP